MSISLVSLGSLYLYWRAQRAVNAHVKSGEPDALENDPLMYTALKTYLFAPALLGIIKLLLFLKRDTTLPQRAWTRMLATHTKYQLIKLAYCSGMLLYFGVGLPNLALDYFKFPQCLYKYKIQPEAEVDYSVMLPRLVKTLVPNLLGPVFFAMVASQEQKDRAAEFLFDKFLDITPELPSYWQVIRHYTIFLMTYDVLFFYAHFALHTKTLYSWIHKKHHEWKSPTALASAYAHPIEHVLSNVAPAAVPLLFMKQHLLSFWLYTHVGLLVALSDHSGYEFIHTSAAHNIHHRTFTSNFGITGLFDRVYDTRVMDKPQDKQE